MVQIIFEEADVNSQRQLGPDELAILITAAYSEYCGEPGEQCWRVFVTLLDNEIDKTIQLCWFRHANRDDREGSQGCL